MQADARPLRVLAVLPGLGATAIIYILHPFSELQKTGRYQFEYVIETDVEPFQIRAADVILLSRNTEPEHGWILDEIIALGKPYSFDLDDMFWDLPYDVPVALYLREPHRVAFLDRYIQNADLVRVFTERAYARVSPMNPNTVQAIPCIDLRLTPPPPPKPADEPLRITYATGRQSEDVLLNLFMDDLERVLDRYPSEKVMFTFWGEIPPRFANHPSVELAPILYNYEAYLEELSSGKYDIGLAPMIESDFYLAKTNTKFRDYAAGRLAGIYSNVELYECIRDEENGLLVGDQPGAWYDAIVRLIEDADLRHRIQKQSYQDVYENYRQELAEVEWERHLQQLVNSPKRPLMIAQWAARQPEPKPLTCLSLGGAAVVAPGVVNAARTWVPGVTVIADPECGLPFAEATFEVVVANHTLSEANSLSRVVQEIYRVCKDQAQVSVFDTYTSPAATPTAGLQALNEDTPRRWTTAQTVPVPEMFYIPQGSEGWGLGELKNVELLPVRMEFFYALPFVLKKNEERRKMRRSKADVCEKILFHFVASKQPVDSQNAQQRIKPMTYVEPAEASIRRVEENNRDLLYALEAVRKELREVKTKQEQYRVADIRDLLHLSQRVACELSIERNRKIVRMIRTMFDRVNLADNLNPEYRRLMDDSLILLGGLKGYLLQLSDDLNNLPFLPYQFQLPKGRLHELILAPYIDVPVTSGVLGVELVQVGRNRALSVASVPAELLKNNSPISFTFPMLPDLSDKMVELRIFADNVNAPVRVYEWRKYSPLRIPKPDSKPFCGFGIAR